MSPLIILGAGPHAYEMADLVRQVNRVVPTWDPSVFWRLSKVPV